MIIHPFQGALTTNSECRSTRLTYSELCLDLPSTETRAEPEAFFGTTSNSPGSGFSPAPPGPPVRRGAAPSGALGGKRTASRLGRLSCIARCRAALRCGTAGCRTVLLCEEPPGLAVPRHDTAHYWAVPRHDTALYWAVPRCDSVRYWAVLRCDTARCWAVLRCDTALCWPVPHRGTAEPR